MLFNSITYFIFLPIVYLVYVILPSRLQNITLLIASYIFYAWWDVRFLSLIAVSTATNYCCGLMIKDGVISTRSRLISSVSIIFTCLFSLLIPWSNPPSSFNIAALKQSLSSINTDFFIIFIVVCLIVIAANLVYPKIALYNENKKKLLFVTLGVAANLFILGFFKYYNFFIDNIELLLRDLDFDPTRFHLNIVLPIGISFFTFKGISYVVDVYRGNVVPENRYLNFALFIGFFPALLAGPLDRAKDLLPQFAVTRKFNPDNIFAGLHLFLYGLFKKVVIADGVVRTVNSVFGSSGQVSWIDVIIASVFFTIQIYCDFSGYTDMARGTAKFFGINLTLNFDLPYFSKNPQEFWKRWHISLSSWLRDYLYISLGGNRDGKAKTYRNLMITMALGGLWHGAAWNFILWGIYHGILLCIHRAVSSVRSFTLTRWTFFGNTIKLACFFLVTCYGWLLFRAGSLEKIISLTSVLIFDFGNMDFRAMRPRAAVGLGLPILLFIELIEYSTGGKRFYEKLPIPAWTATYALMIFVLFLGMSNESAQFIYFNF
jgi:alginate O-acetyltransferase complex protein AlgI